MRFLLFILAFVSFNITAQGILFSNPEQLEQIDQYSNNNKGYVENLPSSISLEKYVPPIIRQQGGTCVSFSIYYGLSTYYNIINNTTDSAEKFVFSFDPYFIYTLLNDPDKGCDQGLYMNKAMEALFEIGNKKIFYPKYLLCDSKWNREDLTKTVDYTLPYRLKNFYFINPKKPGIIKATKQALYYKLPVLIGVQTTKSLAPYNSDNSKGVTSNGLWNPDDNEKIDGGHAMCVIAYDDYKFGGSFKMANSWGHQYGDNGYVWIKYTDYQKFVKEAYVLDIGDPFKTSSYQRIDFADSRYKGHIYEGQMLDGYLHGEGIYSFGDDTYLIGRFNKGSREGWFYYIDGNDDKNPIQMMKFANNKVIDTELLGFSEVNEKSFINSTEKYFQTTFPDKKVIIINEEPDFEMAKKIK